MRRINYGVLNNMTITSLLIKGKSSKVVLTEGEARFKIKK